MINILLADDHKLMRSGIRALISDAPDMTIVAEAENGREAVELAMRLEPDVIIMDISMPGLNGIDATRRILAERPDIKILALSVNTNKRIIRDMLDAGACGYILKDCAIDEVIAAVLAVVKNNTYLSPGIAGIVVKDYIKNTEKDDLSPLALLSSREREVLQLLAEGNRSKDIAEILGLSVKTAEFHRNAIMKKLNARSLADLTRIAIREGLASL